MPEEFEFDAFLSHSSKDKPIVRPLAERLRKDGVRVWLDEWAIKPGDSIPAKIEEGLERSRLLVLCMSKNAFASDWPQLEGGTFRFRDPLNKERRFIPLRLDDAPIKGSLAQFLYISWNLEDRGPSYKNLLDACLSTATTFGAGVRFEPTRTTNATTQRDPKLRIWNYAFSADEKRFLTAGEDKTVRLWNADTGRCIRTFKGHTESVWSVLLSFDEHSVVSGSWDNTIRIWDVETGRCHRVLKGHTAQIFRIAWSDDQRRIASVSDDRTVRLWDVSTGDCLQVLDGYDQLRSVAWSRDQRLMLCAGYKTISLLTLSTGLRQELTGSGGDVYDVTWSKDQRSALSCGYDRTIRLWDIETQQCVRIFEGHTDPLHTISLSDDNRYVLSGGMDKTVRLWNVATGQCLGVLNGESEIRTVRWSHDHRRALAGDINGHFYVWNLTELLAETASTRHSNDFLATQIQYTNAKVLLVGESGAGKTGLSKVLAGEKWQPSDSTVGAWATQWKLPVSAGVGVEREIWLWDFGGQADQRLIHQLYMDDTALAALVFDGQKENLFETLGQWDRDLTRASSKQFSKLLVAGRVDAGGLRVSRSQVDAFRKERDYVDFVENERKNERRLSRAKTSNHQWHRLERDSLALFSTSL